MPITTLAEMPECRLGHSGSVFVSVWFSRLTIATLDELEKHHRLLGAKYGKITFLSVVMGAAESPPADVRERMKQTAAELQKLRHANLIVISTKGLSAIIARSFMAMLSLISAEKLQVFKSIDEALIEVKKYPGGDAAPTTAELTAFAEAKK